MRTYDQWDIYIMKPESCHDVNFVVSGGTEAFEQRFYRLFTTTVYSVARICLPSTSS